MLAGRKDSIGFADFPASAASSSARRARFAARTRPAKMSVSSTNGSFSPQAMRIGGYLASRWLGSLIGERC